MRRSRSRGLRPGVERFEAKQLPSAGPAAVHARSARPAAVAQAAGGGGTQQGMSRGFELFRITDTKAPIGVTAVRPTYQVLVQAARPVPGQTYNILELSVRNGTPRTFSAADGLDVATTSGGPHLTPSFPILTGDQLWRPGEFITFYLLSKKYYPLPQVAGGFVFNFLPGSVAIPGPSGIALRVKYEPATFPRVLDYYVGFGPGAEGGAGPKVGLPDTAIWQFVDAGDPDVGRNAPR